MGLFDELKKLVSPGQQLGAELVAQWSAKTVEAVQDGAHVVGLVIDVQPDSNGKNGWLVVSGDADGVAGYWQVRISNVTRSSIF